jgi:hypothetical protein
MKFNKINKKVSKNQWYDFLTFSSCGKKGLMIKFLTTVILAIVIFAPACIISSKFFRLSDQAKKNFSLFVDETEDLAVNGKEDERRNNMFILDKETVMAYFSAPRLRVSVDANEKSLGELVKEGAILQGIFAAGLVTAGAGLILIPILESQDIIDFPTQRSDLIITIDRPPACEKKDHKGGCICLFREVEPVLSGGKLTINPIKTLCKPVDFDLIYGDTADKEVNKEKNCGIGVPHNVHSYLCKGGFFVDRGVIVPEDEDEDNAVGFSGTRRINFVIEKIGGPDSNKVRIKYT